MRQPNLLKPDPRAERQESVATRPRNESLVAPVFAERYAGSDPRIIERDGSDGRESGDSLFADNHTELPLVW